MHRHSYRLALVILGLLLIMGCSGGGDGSPLTPGTQQMTDNRSLQSTNSHMLWGMWTVEVPDSGNVEITPLRGAAFNANVTKFLQPPLAPIHLLTVTFDPLSDFTTGHLILDITLQHPFIGYEKFRGFDVRGIVMGDGSVPFNFDGSVWRAGPDDLTLENADGWTRWWNPTEFTSYGIILGYTQGAKSPPSFLGSATINPYKYFADSLEKDDPLADLYIDDRGTFSVDPGINTRQYVLQFPYDPDTGPSYKFNYAIDASWALPGDEFDPQYPPEAYPPEANMQEAWRVEIDDEGSTAWYINEDANGGSLMLNVEVFDWQASWSTSGVLDEVTAIHVDCPLIDGPVDMMSIGTPLPGGPVSSVWTAEIMDPVLEEAGMFDCWIGVEAAYPANYAPQIEGDPNNFDWPDAPLTAYAHGIVEVSSFFPSDAPVIDEIIPNQGEQSTVVTDLRIIGDNFQDGAAVWFEFDTMEQLTVSDIEYYTPSMIMCDLDCSGPIGFYDVTVENPDTQQGSMDDGFEVTEPEQGSIWWQSQMYNCENIGRNPMVPGADPETLEEKWATPVGGNKKYCTPVVAEDKIFFTGNDGFYGNTSMTMHCFDLFEGTEMWSHPINTSNVTSHRAFACPVWYRAPDGSEYVAVGGDQLYCWDANTGDELWTFDDTYNTSNVDWISNQMQEWNGYLLARSRYPVLYVFDMVTGDLISQVDCTSSSEGGCGAFEGYVYISSGKYIDCADIMTGEIQWTTPLPHDAAISHWMNPSIVNDRVYTSTYQGYVFAIAAMGNTDYTPGEIIWEWNDPTIGAGSNPLVGGTAVIEDKIFIAAAFNGNYVYCIQDLGDSADTFWRSSSTGYFDASPVWSTAPSYPDGVVYCPDRGGYIRAYDAADGSQIWAYDTGGEFRAGVSPVLDALIVTSGTEVFVFKGP